METVNLTKDQIHELGRILEMLKSEDKELKILACGIFKSMFPENALFNVQLNEAFWVGTKFKPITLFNIHYLDPENKSCLLRVYELEAAILNALDSGSYIINNDHCIAW